MRYDKENRKIEELAIEKEIEIGHQYAFLAVLVSHETDEGKKLAIRAEMGKLVAESRYLQSLLDSHLPDRFPELINVLSTRTSRDRNSDMVQRAIHKERREYGDNRLGGKVGRGLTYVCNEIPELRAEYSSHQFEKREVYCG